MPPESVPQRRVGANHILGGSNVRPVALDDNRPGRVVILNGGSSAGKTTLGRKLQSSLAGSWLLLGIDLFIWTLPAEMISDPDGLLRHEGVITRGRCFMSLWAGYQVAVAALARSGVDVLLDDVMLEGVADQRRWDDALHDLDVYWVGVRCAAEIAAEREAERGDRPTGIARHQAVSVHEGVRYDREVDTGVLGVPQSVNVIGDALRRRWSIQIAPASEEPPTIPPASAWTGNGGFRPAPWER
jgi:chloramphenicol 3-O phosphotransferase